MYVVMNRVVVKSDWEAEFESRFQKRAGQIDKQPGFVRMAVLKSDGEKICYIVETTWNSKNDFENWVESEDFKLAHQNSMPKEAFGEGGGLEMFNVVVNS